MRKEPPHTHFDWLKHDNGFLKRLCKSGFFYPERQIEEPQDRKRSESKRFVARILPKKLNIKLACRKRNINF